MTFWLKLQLKCFQSLNFQLIRASNCPGWNAMNLCETLLALHHGLGIYPDLKERQLSNLTIIIQNTKHFILFYNYFVLKWFTGKISRKLMEIINFFVLMHVRDWKGGFIACVLNMNVENVECLLIQLTCPQLHSCTIHITLKRIYCQIIKKNFCLQQTINYVSYLICMFWKTNIIILRIYLLRSNF